MNKTASDSSFFICTSVDLGHRKWLDFFADKYSFVIGKQIENEIRKAVFASGADPRFTVLNYDYSALILPFFGRDSSHIHDGEYEAIGIAYHLTQQKQLHVLILDDQRAKNFCKIHFPGVHSKTVGTIGFVRDACLVDCYVSKEEAIEMLDELVAMVEANTTPKRPCGMDKKQYAAIIKPVIEKLKVGS